MASTGMVAILYAIIALAISPVIFSAPTPGSTCAPVCTPGRQSSVLKFEEGKTYIYNFETEVVTQLVGTTDETNRIKVKGQAAVAAQSACDLVLTVQQIAITSTSGQAISRVSDIEGSSIRFAYSDGVIDSVCVSDDDPIWSTNIKRAIVSMLGNRALNGDTETIETDVNGKCKTTYNVNGNRYTKTKDLLGCTNRDGGMANAFGVPYTAPSKYHSIPLFNSILSCTQELGKGVIQTVECTESHSLDVLYSSAVRTDIKSSLNLANVQSSIIKGRDPNKKSCLLYDFGDATDGQKQKAAASNAVDLLNKVCTEVESGTVSLKVPGLFLQLRKQVRYARRDDLKLMDDQITSGKLCPQAKEQLRKILLDASAMSAGDGAISFLAEVIAKGQVQETTKDLFIAYTAFAEHPGPNALEGVNALISRPETEPEYLLAASGLAHQYCRLANPNCGANEQYQALVNNIAQRVNVATEEEAIEKVIVALQALGNVDNLTPTAVTSIVNLLTDSNTNQRLKVRALDGFRRDPCQETLKKKAGKIFSDIKESSQVRIQAYLTLSRCLTVEDIPVVQAVINNDEESNQVGSFVVSHVINILESSSPDKLALRKVFEQITLREFPSDVRKFSRNYEISAFDPSLMNSGLSLDANVIFSQDSYIPRCSNTNFTVAAFGRSYNLLEFGLCVEDFEDVIERLLGPASKVRSVTLDDIVREGADQIGQIRNSISNRFKRAALSSVNEKELEDLRNEVDIKERTGSDGNGDIYVRVLGTSILVESFSQNGMKRQPLIARIQRAIEKLAQGAKEQNIEVTEPFMFMDDEFIMPTSSGLPLTVTTEGTSVLSLQITGNLDIPSLLRGNNGDMKTKIMPSAATVVRAKMVLGSGPIESGLALEGKIHSAGGVDLKVLRENQKFELRATLPQERIQLVDVRSDIYWVEQAIDQLEKKTPMKIKAASRSIIDNQCSSALTKTIGLKVCADVKVPQVTLASPHFFLNGPSVASFSIEKVEPSMEGYYLKVETLNEGDTYGLDLVLDTPGSRTNRKISAQARALAPSSATPQYTLKVESPLNNVEVNYKRSFTDALVGAELKVAVDGDAYTGVAEVRKTAEGSGYKLVPLVQYQLPNGNPVKLLEGVITREPGKKLTVDIKTGGPIRSARGSIKGSVEITQNDADNQLVEYKNLEFTSEVAGKILLDGSFKRQGKLYDLKVNSKYGQEAEHTLTFDASAGSPAPRENILKVLSRSSRRELLNFDLDWALKRTDNKIDHHLKYSRGLTDPKVVVNQNSVIQIVSAKEFELKNDLTIQHPTYNIDFHADAEAKSVPGQDRHAKLEAHLGQDLKAKATYEGHGPFFSNYKVLGNLVAGEKTYELSEVATKVDENKRNFKSRLSVQPGFFYEANTDVYLKYEKGDFKSELTSEITSDKTDLFPILFKSTVVAKPDGYGALLTLDSQGKNYVDLQTTHEVTRSGGVSYATKMKAHLLNIIDAKLSNTYSNGNGDLVLDALLAKSGRRIAGTSKIQRNGDAYDLKADLKWDADRDPSRAITLKSITTLAYSELRLDSQNDITVIGKNAKVNLRGSLSRDILNGESTAEFDYTSPSGKTISASSKIELENQPKVRGGKIYIRVAPADVPPSDIQLGVRVSNIDQQDRTYEVKTDLKANYRNEKDLTVHGELSSALPGNYRSYAGRVSAEGTAIPKPVAASFKADVKSGRVAVKGETTNPVKSSLDATLDYDYWSPKKTLGVKYTIATPIERIQSLEGEIQGAYVYNSVKNFEVSHQVSLTLNGGSPYSSTYHLTVLENEAKYNHKFVSEGKPVVTIAAEGKLDRRHLRGNFNADVRGVVSKLNLDVEHQLPNIAITLNGQSTIVDGMQNFELKISNKKNPDGTLDTEILARNGDEDKLRITNKLEYSTSRRSVDAQVIVGDETPRKLFLLFHEEKAGKWNVEALVRWGEEGKYVSTKGSLNKIDGAFDGELTLDSPHFQANKYSMRVSKSINNGQHGVDITIDGNNKRQIAIAMTYAAKSDSSYEKSYEGTVKIEGQPLGKPVDFNGNFRLDDTQLDRQRDNGEEGRRIRAAVEINADNSPVKVNLLMKRSNKENRLRFSLCKDSDGECRVGNIQLKHLHGDDGYLDYELRVTAEKVVGETIKETNGIVFQSKLDQNSRQFDHVAKLIIGEEKSGQIGYRVYCNPSGKEVGGEVLLPARVIALVATGTKTGASGYNAELAFYIDKTKKADRKISLLLNIGEKTSTSDNGKGRTLEAIFRHPNLNKDLKIQTRYAYGGDATILDVEMIIDVLQAGSEIVTSYKITKQVLSEGRVYGSAFAVNSKGLHINLDAKEEFKYINREFSYKYVVNYENRDKEMKTSQIVLGISKQRFNFEIDGPSKKVLSFISAYVSHPNGGEIRYEIFLPGMEDTRIVRAIANTVSPRNVQLKITTSANTHDQYVEAFLGFRSNDELAAGLYDYQTDGRHVVGDVTLGMNGTRILSVKSDWNKENAHVVLTRVQQRGGKQVENLRELISKSIEEIAKEAGHVISNIRTAAPDVNAVVTASREQLQELQQELQENEDTKLILQRIAAGGAYLRQVTRMVLELARTARRIVVAYIGGLREALKSLPEQYNQILERLPEFIEKLQALATRGVDALVSGSRVAAKVLLETTERLYESLPPVAEMWNWIVDHTEGLVQTLSEIAQKLSQKLAKIYAAVGGIVDRLWANKTLQTLLRELVDRAQGLLEEFIADTKEQLESVKNYVINAVPQKEFQAFIEALADYIQKKAQKATVDDAAALRNIYEKLRATIKQALADIFTIDLEKGIFRAQIPLPVSLKSLSEFGKVFSLPSRPKIHFRIPSYTYGLRELINQLRSGAAFNELLPPFKGYALLIGSKHYKTFDGRFYEFESDCQYLLASDFDDKNFTVVVDYHSEEGKVSEKSVVVTDHHDTVAFMPDYSIVVNGKTVTIDNSKVAGNLLIERIGNWVVVRTNTGAVVGCSVSEDVCAVKLDGFYHGKVLGLLGKMNLEKFDDLRKPNGDITPSVEVFAESWKLDKCVVPTIMSTMIQSTQSAAEKCSAALDSKRSSLRPCYGVVDPTPYRNICEKLSQRQGYTEEKAVCTASIAYAKACYLSYAQVDPVPACAAA